uniref:Hypothetical secreted peptide 628 n=1 Tax=Amblyomma variegatum TaxID=34610 RepID=F0JA67_AMBVA|nr:TPA_inf: hypothetical secreted peptide precursor 628 [Amblyomma variegatum]
MGCSVDMQGTSLFLHLFKVLLLPLNNILKTNSQFHLFVRLQFVHGLLPVVFVHATLPCFT